MEVASNIRNTKPYHRNVFALIKKNVKSSLLDSLLSLIVFFGI